MSMQRQSKADQFDLFSKPPGAEMPPPQWRELPAETQAALTKMMVRLILDHVVSGHAAKRTEAHRDV
jgi:hypothetical protein